MHAEQHALLRNQRVEANTPTPADDLGLLGLIGSVFVRSFRVNRELWGRSVVLTSVLGLTTSLCATKFATEFREFGIGRHGSHRALGFESTGQIRSSRVPVNCFETDSFLASRLK